MGILLLLFYGWLILVVIGLIVAFVMKLNTNRNLLRIIARNEAYAHAIRQRTVAKPDRY